MGRQAPLPRPAARSNQAHTDSVVVAKLLGEGFFEEMAAAIEAVEELAHQAGGAKACLVGWLRGWLRTRCV